MANSSGVRLNAVAVGKAMKKIGFDRIMNPERKVYGYYLNAKV